MNVEVGNLKRRLVKGEYRDLVSTSISASHDEIGLVVSDSYRVKSVSGCRSLLHRANLTLCDSESEMAGKVEDEADDDGRWCI